MYPPCKVEHPEQEGEQKVLFLQVTQLLMRLFPGVGIQIPFDSGDLDTIMIIL